MNVRDLGRSLHRTVRLWLGGCPTPLALCGAGALMLCGGAVRFVSGSPYRFGIMAHFGHMIPPVWLMALLWTVWYGVLGATLCVALLGGGRDACSRAEKYRGGMLFIGMVFLGFLWYPLFFSAGHVALAAVLLLVVLVLCILTGLCWLRAARAAGVVMLLHAAFLAWLLILNVALVFRG